MAAYSWVSRESRDRKREHPGGGAWRGAKIVKCLLRPPPPLIVPHTAIWAATRDHSPPPRVPIGQLHVLRGNQNGVGDRAPKKFLNADREGDWLRNLV